MILCGGLTHPFEKAGNREAPMRAKEASGLFPPQKKKICILKTKDRLVAFLRGDRITFRAGEQICRGQRLDKRQELATDRPGNGCCCFRCSGSPSSNSSSPFGSGSRAGEKIHRGLEKTLGREAEDTPQTFPNCGRPVAGSSLGPWSPKSQGTSPGSGHALATATKGSSAAAFASGFLAPKPGAASGRRDRRLPLSPGRRRGWGRVSVSRHKETELRTHPSAPPEAAKPVPLTPPPVPGHSGARAPGPRRPRAAPSPPERSAGAAGPAPLPATQCGAAPPAAASAAGRGPHKSPPPAAAHPPWAPEPGSRSVLVTAFQTWQPSRQSRSAADLPISAPGPPPARPRRPPGRSGASGAAGGRACLHVASLRAPGPPSNWPRPRSARRPAPQPRSLPPPRTPVGSPQRRRRGPAHPLTPPRPAPPAGGGRFPGPGATWRRPRRGKIVRREPAPLAPPCSLDRSGLLLVPVQPAPPVLRRSSLRPSQLR